MTSAPASEFRQTLAAPVLLEGVGAHTGARVSLHALPAEAGTGLIFKRTDLPGSPIVPVNIAQLDPEKCRRCTVVSTAEAEVSTPEHLLSAAMGLHIDDAVFELTGPEVPFLDGSAAEFAKAFAQAGLSASDIPATIWGPTRPVHFQDGAVEIHALPSSSFSALFVYKSAEPLLSYQTAYYDAEFDSYAKAIAPARTFGFLSEVDALWKAGLIKGASLANAVIFGRKHLLNNSLRMPDEPARHKILDFIGDMAPLSVRLTGRYICVRSGHRAHARFAHMLSEMMNNSGASGA